MPRCSREGCENEFEARKSGGTPQRFCSPECRAGAKTDAERKPSKSIDEVVADAAERDRHREEARELRILTAQEQRIRRYTDVLEECLIAYEPTELAVPRRRSREAAPEHEDVLVLGDWHVGQRTTLEETGGLYHHDIATVRAQVAKVWEAYDRIRGLAAKGRTMKKLHIIFLGDLNEGDSMRVSQVKKIEEVVTVQTVQGFDLLAWLIRQALQVYAKVEVEVIGGNHDRTSTKPGDGGLGELSYVDTFAWLVGEFLKRVLENDIKGGHLAVKNWDTFFGYKEIAGVKVVFEHGSSFKWSAGGYGGVPWYAIQMLGARYSAMCGEVDCVLLGHGHRPAIIPIEPRGWIISNGALPATSTYIQAGRKTVSRPHQWRLSMHKDHGIVDFTPIYADVPGTVLPRDFWAPRA